MTKRLIYQVVCLVSGLTACARPSPARIAAAPADVPPAQGEPAVAEQSLTLLRPPPLRPARPDAADRLAAETALRAAHAAAAAGDPDRSRAALREAAARVPTFAGWARLQEARFAASECDTAEVRRLLVRIPPGAAREWSWRILVGALESVGDVAGALQAAEDAAGSVHAPAEQAALHSEIGRLRSATGATAGAREAFAMAMRLGSGHSGALDAARAALELPGLGGREQALIARTLLARSGWDRGTANLDAALGSGALDPEEELDLRLVAGRALFAARRFADAERYLSPISDRSAEASFLTARAQYRRGRRAEGSELLAATARRFPGDAFAAEALYLLGDLAHGSDQPGAAREHYRQALATRTRTPAQRQAAVRLAALELHRGRAAAVIEHLSRFTADRQGAEVAGALYWLGRAHLQLGDVPAADASFRGALEADPFSYYGMLAASRLGLELSQIPLAPSPLIDASAAARVDDAFLRSDLLRLLHLQDEAAFELERLRSNYEDRPEALYLVAEGMMERGQPIAGALLGRRIHQMRGEWDERLLRIVFQFPYRDLVFRESERNSLDPFTVAGLIRQESFFNAIAVSSAGAVGLMQVMPATGRGLARGAGISDFQTAMLRDPEVNVRLGTLFLADQMRRWGGKQTDVFAAYNAGPGRIARWRALPEYRDEDVFVERIPIAETRDYVKKVRMHGQIYRRLYGEG